MKELVTILKELPVARTPYQVAELARGSEPYLYPLMPNKIQRAGCENCAGTATNEAYLIINPSNSFPNKVLHLSGYEYHSLTNGCSQIKLHHLRRGYSRIGYFSEQSRRGNKQVKVKISDRKLAKIRSVLGI